MQFDLETRIEIDIDDSDAREKGYLLSSKIFQVEFDECGFESQRTEVGHLSAYRLFGEADELFHWADNASQDLRFAVEWLRCQEGDLAETALAAGCMYLSDVWIEPAWRGRGFTLKAIAAFLGLFAKNSFVFLSPLPNVGNDDAEQRRRRLRKMRLFCQKLGLHHYDPQGNIIWEPEWYCPEPLLGNMTVL